VSVALWERDGLRVVELGAGISAAFGARLLADFGADVIKVEPPASGDESRRAGPFPGDVPDIEKSGLYLYLNFNKRAVTLDVESPSGAALLARLIQDADVVIENLSAGRFDSLPLPQGAIGERLIVCSISPYGQDGPKAEYLGSELSAYASGGLMYITGEAEREPLKQALNQASHHAGVNAASAVLTASFLQRRRGLGQRVDISEQETMAMTIFPALSTYSYTGGVMRRGRGTVPRLISSMPMPTKDGWIMPSYAGLGTWWESFAGFMELPEAATEEFSTAGKRRERAVQIDEMFGERFKERPTSDLFHGGQEWGLTLTALQSVADVAESDHLVERGFFIEQDHPVAGRVKMPGPVPFASNVSRTPVRPAPMLGQHNAEIFGELGLTLDDLKALTGAGIV
jgi:crotonobetainyl-CoA:carnitine CoA-transferase CaiB-like acyl-CoA transferase